MSGRRYSGRSCCRPARSSRVYRSWSLRSPPSATMTRSERADTLLGGDAAGASRRGCRGRIAGVNQRIGMGNRNPVRSGVLLPVSGTQTPDDPCRRDSGASRQRRRASPVHHEQRRWRSSTARVSAWASRFGLRVRCGGQNPAYRRDVPMDRVWPRCGSGFICCSGLRIPCMCGCLFSPLQVDDYVRDVGSTSLPPRSSTTVSRDAPRSQASSSSSRKRHLRDPGRRRCGISPCRVIS